MLLPEAVQGDTPFLTRCLYLKDRAANKLQRSMSNRYVATMSTSLNMSLWSAYVQETLTLIISTSNSTSSSRPQTLRVKAGRFKCQYRWKRKNSSLACRNLWVFLLKALRSKDPQKQQQQGNEGQRSHTLHWKTLRKLPNNSLTNPTKTSISLQHLLSKCQLRILGKLAILQHVPLQPQETHFKLA